MGSVDYKTTMKLDLKNDYEAQVRDSVGSAPHSSQEIESFRTFQNDMVESVKNSLNSPIHDPLEETDSFEDSADLYMDKSVTECEPELVICHKETSYNIVKDICVDEGGPTKDKIFFGRKEDEDIYKTYPSWSYEHKQTMKDNIGINLLNPPVKDECDQSKDLMQLDEEATGNLADNVYKEIVVLEDKVLLQVLDIEKSRTLGVEGDEIQHNHAKVDCELEFHSQPDKSKNVIEEDDALLSSPAFESNIDILDSSSLLQENGNRNMAHQFDHSAPGISQVRSYNCGKTEDAANSADVKYDDDQGVTNQYHHRLGESSFSSVGYLGHIPYCGSISLRSDSSTASTRSFAFPILQSEWNSSPVRLAKPDRRHRRKLQGWRQHLLCCKF